MDEQTGASEQVVSILTRPVVAGLVLLLFYGALSLLMSPDGYLGTDTGAKVYTLEVMDRNDTTNPDVGYWAAEHDPDGRVHPLFQAAPRADGGWVIVTTLPVLEAARPLYEFGGYRATLLLPMLGSVGTAFAAFAVARRLGSERDAWRVFWIVGVASPAVVYALDFWEHSIGMALMVGAVALLLDVIDRGSVVRAVGAGACFGAAAVLRNEAFVYAAVAVGTTCVVRLWRHRSVVPPAMTGVASIVGFAGPWLANVALERAVDGPSRSTRASGTATRVGEDVGERVREGLQTLFGLNAGTFEESVFLGIAVVGIILIGFRGERLGDQRFLYTCLGGAFATHLATAAGGLGFVPGILVAFPLSVAAFVQARRTDRHLIVAAIALVALPFVYAFQFVGGGAPQWSGRYTLASVILLAVVGMVGLLERYPRMGVGLVALSFVVTMLGVGWLWERSHGVDEFFEDVAAEAESVVISRNAFLVREGGAAAVGERWLSVKDEETFELAIDVAREVGEERFSVLEWGGEAPPDESIPEDVSEVDRTLLSFVNVPVGLVTYEFVG